MDSVVRRSRAAAFRPLSDSRRTPPVLVVQWLCRSSSRVTSSTPSTNGGNSTTRTGAPEGVNRLLRGTRRVISTHDSRSLPARAERSGAAARD